MYERLSPLILYPVAVTKVFFELTREVLDFEPRPGSDKGYEPRVTFKAVIERVKNRIEAQKEG